MNLGKRVKCSAYIKPSKNHYDTYAAKNTQDKIPACEYLAYGASEGVAIEDCHNCDRYKTIEKEFSGVYVGTTTLCTRLNAEYYEDDYGNTGYRTYCDNPQKFAIVYYANNKKRLVPIGRINPENETEAYA